MSLYVILDPNNPNGESVLLENRSGVYEDLEVAREDLMSAAYREHNLDLTLYRLNGYTVQATDLVREYSSCPICGYAVRRSEPCSTCGGRFDGNG